MRGFRYKYGDKPLEGYTIQRAAGRGGFGEVYYAVSDSGREVALKVVQGYEDIELRGVGQCMNLKSPHLVTIFDVKKNEDDVPFVIMEFVSGPSLRQLLDECPSGMGTQKAAFFLREIGKGLAFLHDCGIVHRDLKPGNIFYENGYVKIGDYGLSKAMEPDHRSGQTVTVGTVHYMAPEISMGKYDRTIDIYALGAILFEMLTGQVPYLGGSAGEILMKHMTAEPCVAGLEEPFATVIKKSMARDPQDRYQSVQDMVEAVFGAEHVQQSMSCFSPDSLSMVAERVARRVSVGGGSATPPPLPKAGVATAEGDTIGAWAERFGQRMGEFGERMGRMGERIGQKMGRVGEDIGRRASAKWCGGAAAGADPAAKDAAKDSLSNIQRAALAIVLTVLMAGAMGALMPLRDFGAGPIIAVTLLVASGAGAGMRAAYRWMVPQLARESAGMRRLALGGIGACSMFLMGGPLLLAAPAHAANDLWPTVLALLAPLFIVDWYQCLRPGRKERVAFGSAIVTALWAALAALILDGMPLLAAGMAAAMALMAQALSPWIPAGAGAAPGNATALPQSGNHPAGPPGPIVADVPPQVVIEQAVPGVPVPPPLPRLSGRIRQVPVGVRMLWLGLMVGFLITGVLMLVYAGISHWQYREDEFCLVVSFGVGFILLSVVCLIKTVQSQFTSLWRYLGMPLLLWVCAQTILISAIIMGTTRLTEEETVFAVFFIIFPVIVMPLLMFVRFRRPQPLPANQPTMLMAQPQAQVPQTSVAVTVGDVITGGRNFLLALVGWCLLAAAVALGLGAAVDIPSMINAGIPDPSIAENIRRDAAQQNVNDWAQLMKTLLVCFSGVGMFLAAVFMMMSRRTSGFAHMFRTNLGIIAIVGGLFLLHAGLAGHWVAINDAMGRVSPAASINAFLDGSRGAPVFMGAVCMLTALVFLMWPASKSRRAPIGA